MGDSPALHFALLRCISLGDIDCLRELLLARGHHDARLLDRYGGGIEFGDSNRGIRWPVIGASADALSVSEGAFEASLATVAFRPEPGAAYWSCANRFAVEVYGAFTARELADLSEGLVMCLGLAENTLRNRGAIEVADTDFEVDANLFAGFQYCEAVQAFTAPRLATRQSPTTERLFECWMCTTRTAYYNFNTHGGAPTFCGLLRSYTVDTVPCCIVCQSMMIFGSSRTHCHKPAPAWIHR